MSIGSLIEDTGPIDSYSDQDINTWLDEFKRDYECRIFIPGCPFSFWEVRREYIRRDNCREEIE